MNDFATSPTPILDRTSPMPPPAQRSRGSRIIRVAAMAVGAGIGFMAAAGNLPFFPAAGRILRREIPEVFLGAATGGEIALVMLAPFAALVIVIAVHEAGPVAAGLCVGFRFNSLRISRLQLDRPFRVSISREKGTGASGWTSMFPSGSQGLAPRALAMVSGGPAASLLLGVGILLLPFPKGYFLLWLSFSSLLIGVVNLIPFRSRAFLTDGWRILSLLQNRERAERWVSVIKLGEEFRRGVPPEHWREEFLRKAVALKDKTPDTVAAHIYAHTAALARHQDAQAAEYLETCLEYSRYAAPLMQQALMSEAGVFQARKRKRLDLAEAWMATLPARSPRPWFRARVEAAILEAKGDTPGAIRKLEEIETMLLAIPNQAMREISQRELLRWKSELQPRDAGELVDPPTAGLA